MNELDGTALARSVDSLLNYETVKYFGAEVRER
jgi:ATP-binding cassette subfamily B protein